MITMKTSVPTGDNLDIILIVLPQLMPISRESVSERNEDMHEEYSILHLQTTTKVTDQAVLLSASSATMEPSVSLRHFERSLKLNSMKKSEGAQR